LIGPKNPAVQELRRLFSSPRSRREEKRFAIEGPELLSAALEADWDVEHVFVDPERVGAQGMDGALEAARHAGCEISELSPGVLERVADAATPQPCAAIVVARESNFKELSAARFLIVVDAVQDPGNLGAIVRVAEASGAAGVIVTGASADPFGPKALRGSAGSSFRVPLCLIASISDAMKQLAAAGIEAVVTSPREGEDFAQLSWPPRVALVVGNEANGLSPSVLASASHKVTIPMASTIESLNLSVATGILAMAYTRKLRTQAGHDGDLR